MSLRTSLAGAVPFAHLITPRASAPRVDDDGDMKKQLEDAEKRCEDAEKKADDAEERAKQAEKRAEEAEKRAEDAEKAMKASEEDDDDDDDEDGDDDSDREEMALPKGSRVRAARMRERARCAAIFNDNAAGLNPAAAAQLAFSTSLPRTEALAVLKTTGSRRGLDARMAENPVKPATEDAPQQNPDDPKAIADRILASAAKAKGLLK